MSKRSLFREVNARIRGLNVQFGISEGTIYAVLCECENPECVERVEVPAWLHAEISTQKDCFLVAPGHESRPSDQVIRQSQTYLVVSDNDGLAAA